MTHNAEQGDPDRDWEQERHRRRLMLMRMQGETNRLETWMYTCFIVAGFLAVLALLLMSLS